MKILNTLAAILILISLNGCSDNAEAGNTDSGINLSKYDVGACGLPSKFDKQLSEEGYLELAYATSEYESFFGSTATEQKKIVLPVIDHFYHPTEVAMPKNGMADSCKMLATFGQYILYKVDTTGEFPKFGSLSMESFANEDLLEEFVNTILEEMVDLNLLNDRVSAENVTKDMALLLSYHYLMASSQQRRLKAYRVKEERIANGGPEYPEYTEEALTKLMSKCETSKGGQSYACRTLVERIDNIPRYKLINETMRGKIYGVLCRMKAGFGFCAAASKYK